MALKVGYDCLNFDDRGYSPFYFSKPDGSGTYFYNFARFGGVPQFVASIDSKYLASFLIEPFLDCDQTGTYNISVKWNSLCPITVESVMSEIFTVMSAHNCGQNCLPIPCAIPLIVS
jgi:hypothetical protein